MTENIECTDKDLRLELLWNVFLARKDTYMEHKGEWLRVKEEITKEDVGGHLVGSRVLGSYLLSLKDTVPYIVFDFDSHEKPEEKTNLRPHILSLAEWFRKKRVGAFIEDTGGDGYHLWVLFNSNDIYASRAKKLADFALKEAAVSIEPEIFPKQTKLEKDGVGNGIRLPWGLHGKGNWSHFLNDNFEHDDATVIKAITGCRTINWKNLDELLPQKLPPTGARPKEKGIAPDRWAETVPEGKRHNSLFAIACEFRSRGLPPDRIITELRTHNEARFNPPLADKEVQEIFEGAMKTTGAERISEKESQASLLVSIALQKAAFFHVPEQKGYAYFNNGTNREIWPLRSQGFKSWLMREFYRDSERVPYSEAMTTALSTLEGLALWDNEEKPLFLRVGWHNNSLWYDLGDWQAVHVTKEGWTVELPPILFRHYAHQLPQVHPQPGNVRDFLRFTNVTDEGHKTLLLVYLCCALIPDIPQPILFIHGDQGSAKSSLMRFIRELVDPSITGLLTMPHDVGELARLGHHHRCVYFDNVHHFPAWLIEGMARLATGTAFTKRALFTDEDDVIFVNKGLGGFNGVNLEVDSPDLLDRGIFIRLNRISDDKAMPEAVLIEQFHQAKPSILGGIFDALHKALTVKETQTCLRLPRMADFYSWGCAIATALGLGDFSTVFWDNVKYGSQQALDASIIAPVIERYMKTIATKGTTEWQGTSTELLGKLNDTADDSTKKLKGWPTDPQWLSRKLGYLTPNLIQVGLEVKKIGRTWFFRWVGERIASSVTPEASSELDAKKIDSVDSVGPSDAKDAKKRYPPKIASNEMPNVPTAENAISLFIQTKTVNYYAPDGTPVFVDEWIRRWEEKGCKSIPGRDGRIKDLKKYLKQDDFDFENLTLIRDYLWPKGDWPKEATNDENNQN